LKKGEGPKLGPLTKEQLLAFEALREKLLQPPILALPRREGRYILDTETSDGQIGCCLSRENPDGLRYPNGYWSRLWNPVERNYSTTEKECLAIVGDILTLRPHLDGERFLIRTDHHSLRWVLNLADAQGRLARWRLSLLEFDFEVEYFPGKEHHAVEVMSRLPPSRPFWAEETMGPMPVTLGQLQITVRFHLMTFMVSLAFLSWMLPILPIPTWYP
jgi:RNase H-like domain found in reverse transcriptase